ncbi:MAG: hypothetical protein AB7T06_15950 [Kofleriaceae bacterium]
MRITPLIAVALGVLTTTAVAGKKQTRYVGTHPIPSAEGGGFCEIEAPHVHVFAPTKLEYRTHGKDNFFVGDPVAYGYPGKRHAYKGHHPIYVHAVVGDSEDDVEMCFIDGPHFHAFAPPPEVKAEFSFVGDTYFFIGEPPPIYVEQRPAMVKINAVYQPLRYERPVVTVEPPGAWINLRVGAPAAVVDVHAPAVVVEPRVRAGVEVVVPAPSLEVNIGVGGGVIIDGHHHRHDKGRHRGHYKGKKKRRW